jgi:hypothetical protein
MTANDFRALALSLPDAVEQSHMDHPDFRVGGKIFATLGYPRAGWAMVKLPPGDQQLFTLAEPAAFVPVKGAWGAKGATSVMLKAATKSRVREALRAAWRSTAPKTLVRRHEGGA